MAYTMTHNQHSVQSCRAAAEMTPGGAFADMGGGLKGTPAQAPSTSGVKPSRVSANRRNQRWREKHREYDLARKRAWDEANKALLLERANARTAARSAEDLRRIRETRKAWREANPELHRARRRLEAQRRRALAGGYRVEYVSPSVIGLLIQAQGERCVYCRIFQPAQWHVDHIMPLALGGAHEETNFQMLCADCNVAKGARHPDEFARSIEKGGE
jgi:5-methylcytosine-specific restriction endonuclease McrA